MARKPTPPEMITTEEAARRLGMQAGSLREAMKQGHFPFGTCWKTDTGQWVYKIPRGQFEKYMAGELLSADCLIEIAKMALMQEAN